MINKLLKFVKEHQTLIVGVVISLQLLYFLFKRSPSDTGLSQTKELISAKDETIRAIERERDIYRAWKDSTVSALNSRNNQLEKEYTKSTIKYEKIPIIINAYSRDSLRAAIERY